MNVEVEGSKRGWIRGSTLAVGGEDMSDGGGSGVDAVVVAFRVWCSSVDLMMDNE